MTEESFFLQNSVFDGQKDSSAKQIHLIRTQPDFADCIVKFWRQLPVQFDGSVPLSQLNSYVQGVYHYLLPQYTRDIINAWTEDQLVKVIERTATSVNYEQICDFFARICWLWLEDPNPKAVTLFLNSIYNRTTRVVILRGDKIEKLPTYIHVQFLSKLDIEKTMSDRRKRDNINNFLFYDEQLRVDYDTLEATLQDPEAIVQTQLLSYEDIIPLGFSAENVLTALKNNVEVQSAAPHFGPKEKLAYFKHIPCKASPNADHIQIYASITQDEINKTLKKVLDFPGDTTLLATLLEGGVKDSGLTNYRLNSVLARLLSFEKLKAKTEKEPRFFNVKSSFYKFVEYKIDLVDRLNQRWDAMKKKNFGRPVNETDEQSEVEYHHTPSEALKQEAYLLKLKYFEYDVSADAARRSRPSEPSVHGEQENANDADQESQKPALIPYLKSYYTELPHDNQDPFFEDLIEYAKQETLAILAIGQPKCGRSTLCQSLAQKLGVELVSVELYLEKILTKIREVEENGGPEMDEEGNSVEFLTPLEKSIMESLKNGEEVPQNLIIDLINYHLNTELTYFKGFIFDFPLYDVEDRSYSWLERLTNGDIKLPHKMKQFTHVIDLDCTEQEARFVASSIMEHPEDVKISSMYEREILRKPKPIKLDEEGQPIEEEEEEEEIEKKKKADENILVYRANESIGIVQRQLHQYSESYAQIHELYINALPDSRYIHVDVSGLNPKEVLDACLMKLGNEIIPMRPLAKELEAVDDGSLKDLLRQNYEEEGIPSRRWSAFWAVDPVALSKGRVVQGKGEFPCEYAGRVFVFESEESRAEFMKNPKRFVAKRPKMPKKTYTVSVLGPHMSGKNAVAEFLEKKYGWKVINVEKLIAHKLDEMRNWEQFTPSNYLAGSIHPSEEEYKEFMKGTSLKASDVVPMILHHLNIPTYKRPPKPKEEGEEGQENAEEKIEEPVKEEPKKKKSKKEREKEEEEKRRAEEAAAAALAEGEEPERPKTPPPEDLKLKDIGAQPDKNEKILEPKGFILVGYPYTEDQILSLKDHNIHIDKVIILKDASEEEPGKIFKERENFEQLYSLENELALADNSTKMLQEVYGEEIVREVPINTNWQETLNQVLLAVDPFYIRVDRETDIVVQDDLAETDEPVPWGEYGSYCPVTLLEEGWLATGKKELELQVRGRRYWFYGEAEQTKFRENLDLYVEKAPKAGLKVPGPRLLMMGVKGSGMKTQMNLLFKKYLLTRLDLKEDLLNTLQNEREKRKEERLLLRGFRPPEYDDEGVLIPDPEIEEDPSEFDRRAHEIQIIKQVLTGFPQMIINANLFDVEEDKLQTGVSELLSESKRLPDVCLFLKVTEENMMKRVFNQREIQEEYNRLMEERRVKKEEAKQERLAEIAKQREEAAANGEDFEEPEAEEEVDDADDPEAPNLETMTAEAKEKYTTRRETELGKIDENVDAFEALGIKTIVIDTDRSIDDVFKNICFKLRDVLEKRALLFEKAQMADIDEFGIEKYENSYVYKKGKYMDRNIAVPWSIPKKRELAIAYRNRIYFCKDEEERVTVKESLGDYLRPLPAPKDVKIRTCVFVIGKPKSGKSTLAKKLSEKLGLVHIKIKNILNQVKEDPFWLLSDEVNQLTRDGGTPNNEQIVKLIAKRAQMADCEERGWMLDDFPRTQEQAVLLSQAGLIPDLVLTLALDEKTLKERALKNKEKAAKFGYDPRIIHERLKQIEKTQTELEVFYISTFNNLRYLNSNVSKWGVLDNASREILEVRERNYKLARALITGEPTYISKLSLTDRQILDNLGEFENYSIVGYKSKANFIRSSIRSVYKFLYRNKIYFTSNAKEANDFLESTSTYFGHNPRSINQEAPQKLDISHSLDSARRGALHLGGQCVVSLAKGRIVKGNLYLMCEYKGKYWVFENNRYLLDFMDSPWKYEDLKLPEKMPIQEIGSKGLEAIRKRAKEGDCTAYLEHYLGHVTMKVMAQLGNKRLKYPTLTYQETALKFIAISLKANNTNKDAAYRKKYQEKLVNFTKHCSYPEDILDLAQRKQDKVQREQWSQWEEESYLQSMEEFNAFAKKLKSQEKLDYFRQFIR